ncbi:DUF1294 domain-containing protein [Chryseobacterium taklimakanense]|uniref:DUF1294 domain-containing protein n=1 Tax=Chryseobacterium taklimakanense TaxID=536441 RepID=A0A3G8WNU0_9FLAO|nr:DUF1294 domain-containing protein [Chryseobacterium taklimakanense]AZI21147.1 DUF1294 domain-containing protein [Chryseobacterium taklimakanense]
MGFVKERLITVNLLSFLLFGLDKSKARNSKRRISEFSLLIITLIGGTFGSVMGMLVFRHKISKYSFISMILLYSVIKIINFKQIY